jgi:hypothetical protein
VYSIASTTRRMASPQDPDLSTPLGADVPDISTDAPLPGPGVTVGAPLVEERANRLIGWAAIAVASVIGIFSMGRGALQTTTLLIALAVGGWAAWQLTRTVEPSLPSPRRRAVLYVLGGAVLGVLAGVALMYAAFGSYTSHVWAQPLLIVLCGALGAWLGWRQTRRLDRTGAVAPVDFKSRTASR